MSIMAFGRFLLAGVVVLSCTAVQAREPLWELGLGGSVLHLPAYRGSQETRTYVLPLPYVVYRGERFRVDREGVRGLLFESDRLALDISLDAAVPVASDDTEARRGMPDLDPVVELGPALKIALGQTAGGYQMQLQLPLRRSIATDFQHTRAIGWRFVPQFNLSGPRGSAWRLGANFALHFADDDYHDYYYTVAPAFATAQRPFYDAAGGYSGASVLFSATRRTGRMWFGSFLRYDNLSGAVFADSPLVETEHALMAGVGVAWLFGKSSRTVP